ncbi:MAG: glycosyltransferase family 2 protein [Candidatus Paceibacterota bacterium]
MKISIVIPALNEEAGIASVINQIPTAQLQKDGYEVEIVVVDNGSKDRTAEIAFSHGANVIPEPKRGYGNAYKTGFKNVSGDIIVTGDADMTYPFDRTKELVDFLLDNDLDFLNTNRLGKLNLGMTARIHMFGTSCLSWLMRTLFKCPFRDSQSGMWIFKRSILQTISVESSGMPFSQEIKIEAFTKGFKCDEIPIEYRSRIGKSKLNILKDGLQTIVQLFKKCLSSRKNS